MAESDRKAVPLFIAVFLAVALFFSVPGQADARQKAGRQVHKTRSAGSVRSGREVWLERAHKNADIVLGQATWYGGSFHKGPTASGHPYDMYTFTAAHRTLPFGTIVRVTDQYSGKSVMVCVTDRGPYGKGRIIDMSYAAAARIGLKNRGVSTVGLEVVSDAKGRPLNAREAFFVEMNSPTGRDRLGPYDTFADAAAIHEAMLVAHPEASVVLASRDGAGKKP